MSKVSPKELSAMLQAEVNKREKAKSTGGLSREQLSEIYRQAKEEKSDRDSVESKRSFSLPKLPKVGRKGFAAALLVCAVIAASFLEKSEPTTEVATIVESEPELWTDGEILVLTQLDKRRSELDRREEALKDRERELEVQEEMLLEKTEALEALTKKAVSLQQSKNSVREDKLKQLAEVYGSMAPQDAAPLIAQLEAELALNLLGRMPKKRMAQVLSLMPAERALQLTKALTEY